MGYAEVERGNSHSMLCARETACACWRRRALQGTQA